jgi:hypothetical protein
MRHAAGRLEEEDPFEILPASFKTMSDGAECARLAASCAAAQAYAASVLLTLAAAMDDDPAEEAATDGI